MSGRVTGAGGAVGPDGPPSQQNSGRGYQCLTAFEGDTFQTGRFLAFSARLSWEDKMSNARGAVLSGAVLFGLACNAQGQPAEPPRLQGPGHFSGLFLGANIGAAIGSTGEVNTSGYISGAHIGYDLQISRIFVGVEADIMSTSISAGDFKSSKYEQNFLSSARVRAGYIFADLALYATGGLGFATTAFKSAASIDKSSVKGAKLRDAPANRDDYIIHGRSAGRRALSVLIRLRGALRSAAPSVGHHPRAGAGPHTQAPPNNFRGRAKPEAPACS